MAFFSSPADKYSQTEHPVSDRDIRLLITREHIPTLGTHEQAKVIEDAILARRHGDGKISLRQIYTVLQELVGQKKISKYDRDGVMRVMEKYFHEHFGSV